MNTNPASVKVGNSLNEIAFKTLSRQDDIAAEVIGVVEATLFGLIAVDVVILSEHLHAIDD